MIEYDMICTWPCGEQRSGGHECRLLVDTITSHNVTVEFKYPMDGHSSGGRGKPLSCWTIHSDYLVEKKNYKPKLVVKGHIIKPLEYQLFSCT